MKILKVFLILYTTISIQTLSWAQTAQTLWRYQSNSNCSSITTGKFVDLCKQTLDQTIWICEPAEGISGSCDTPSEWKEYAASSGMVFPSSGIPVSNGSGWDTSIVDNHLNWDAAYTNAGQVADVSHNGYLSSIDYTNFSNKLSTVSVLPGILGNGTGISPLYIDSTVYPKFSDLSLYAKLNSPVFTGNVGIGSVSPVATLDVNGVIYGHNNVGIGTADPKYLLHVFGGSSLTEGNSSDPGNTTTGIKNSNSSGDSRIGAYNSTTGNVFLQATGTDYILPHIANIVTEGDISSLNFMTNGDLQTGGSAYIAFSTGGWESTNERLRIAANGNVGIGTVEPSQKLEVVGTVKATSFTGDGTQLQVYSYVPVTYTDSPYNLIASNFVLANASNGNIVINLPTASTYQNRFVAIKKIDSSSHTVTIVGYDSQTIDGSSSLEIDFQNTVESLFSDGSNWYRF